MVIILFVTNISPMNKLQALIAASRLIAITIAMAMLYTGALT